VDVYHTYFGVAGNLLLPYRFLWAMHMIKSLELFLMLMLNFELNLHFMFPLIHSLSTNRNS
jgi:hypothetical protein